MGKMPMLVALILGLAGSGCELYELSSQAGQHVVYHWRPADRHLCAGTVSHADAFVETVWAHYGMSGSNNPTIDYFWAVEELGASRCWEEKTACVVATPTTRDRWLASVFTDRAIHAHELTHAAVSVRDYSVPTFLDEGFAQRWHSETFGEESSSMGQPLAFDEQQVRDQLDRWQPLDGLDNHAAAYAWFAALEVTFGPTKMAELLQSLGRFASAEEVDAALRRVMGITLGESVTLAAELPPPFFDDPVCQIERLPTRQWAGGSITLDREDARCEDDDVINHGSRVMSLFRLEFPDYPDNPVDVTVTISGARDQLFFTLLPCLGANPNWSNSSHSFHANTSRFDTLGGTYVATLGGDIGPAGEVYLPRVTIDPVQP